MRPLINSIRSPCYKIAKIAARFLKENYQFAPKQNVQKNRELMERLEKVKIGSNHKLVSFVVTNMFGEIPKEELLTLLQNNRFMAN